MESFDFMNLTGDSTVELSTNEMWFFPNTSFGMSAFIGNNTTYNSSGDELHIEGTRMSSDIPIGIVLCFISIMTTVGNAMVLHAVRTEKRLQTVSNYFILSLACADMLIGLIVMPLSTVYYLAHHWPLGLAVCQIWMSIDYVCCTASILNLFILSLDRYWSITSPLKYLRRRTGKRAAILISLVWLVSSLWVIPIVGWHAFSRGGVRLIQTGHCDSEFHTNTVFKVVTAAFNFYIPLIVMVFLYGRIFHEIRRRSNLAVGRCSYGHGHVSSSSAHNNHTNANTYTTKDFRKTSINNHDYRTEYEFDSFNNSNDPESDTNRSSDNDVRLNFKNMALLRRLKHIIRTDRGRTVTSTNCQDHISTSIPNEKLLESETCDPDDDSLKYNYPESNSDSPNGRISISRPPVSVETGINLLVDKKKESEPIVIWRRRSEDELKPPPFPLVKTNREKNHSVNHLPTRSPSHSNSRLVVTPTRNKTKDVTSGIAPKNAKKNTFKLGKLEHMVKSPRKKRFSASLNRERKAAKQLGVIMGCFVLCWLPYFIMFFIVALCKNCIHENIYYVAIWLGYINSTLNPILYPLCNQNFRRAFRRMLHLQPDKKK